MGPLIVSVVVVVVSGIVIGRWLAIGGGAVEPATSEPESERAPQPARLRPARAVADPGTPPWRRVRSGVVLGCLSVAMGAAVAAGVGVVLFVLFTLLRSSVG